MTSEPLAVVNACSTLRHSTLYSLFSFSLFDFAFAGWGVQGLRVMLAHLHVRGLPLAPVCFPQ